MERISLFSKCVKIGAETTSVISEESLSFQLRTKWYLSFFGHG